jgi:two-component system, sensor histidine kinase and response regulator
MNLVTPEQFGDTSTAQVLVVDDSASMREGISAILRHMGCQVTTACNGAEGYEKAQALSPDLILSDLEMPEANGFDLLSSVRSDSALTMVPFVMITGVSDRSSTRRAMELGADDYLTKPFTPDEVMSTVRSRLDKQRNWRQATQALAASYSQGMMGVLPHEFRTPLSSILGFAELMALMAEKGLSPKQTKEFAETIQRSGKTLLSHTTRFLTLTEYQSLQSLGPEKPVFTISRDWVGRQVDEILADQLPTNQVKAELDIAECPLKCREDLLRMMLRELSSNAVKFAASGSTIKITGSLEGSSCRLRIDNNGHQFPLDRIKHIGAFVQFDRDRQEQQGLGIGLAIVSHAARLSQALLDIRNLPPDIVRINLRLRLA